jgi:hypothetical protein
MNTHDLPEKGTVRRLAMFFEEKEREAQRGGWRQGSGFNEERKFLSVRVLVDMFNALDRKEMGESVSAEEIPPIELREICVENSSKERDIDGGDLRKEGKEDHLGKRVKKKQPKGGSRQGRKKRMKSGQRRRRNAQRTGSQK